ncbi:MAG: metalloregulator ArsR/SmtB family transcription factor [Gammaproteobacteria bacterium]|nr:metalloregulator ArsR/SmtB family transcription factor [Gammaproteobacteria bacterium]
MLIQQLKAIADLTRMRLLAICRHGECSVTELAAVIGQSQPRTSQHLKQLCDAGLVSRFRDGKRVFYRVPQRSDVDGQCARLMQLLPARDKEFVADLARLRAVRGERVTHIDSNAADLQADRAIYRALLDLAVTTPIGDLLDIGCGRGTLLKLLAPQATRAVGVDIDADARQLARAELMLAGIPGCSLRQGDMHRLPFDDAEFDTIILDDVLLEAREPVKVLAEARRLLRAAGRLLILADVGQRTVEEIQQLLAGWSVAAGLRLAPARAVPANEPVWILAVATSTDSESQAA